MKYKVNKKRLWLYFVLIPFFPLRGFMEFSIRFKQFMTAWLLVAVFMILIELLLKSSSKSFRIDLNSAYVIGYFLLMLMITICVRKGLGEGLQKMIAAPFLCLLLLMYTNKNGTVLLDVLANIILFDVFANCTVLCPPIFRKISGLTTTLICSIGHVQTASQIGLIGILLSILLKDRKKNRRNIILMLFSFITMAISDTFVSEVILLFLLFCYVFRKKIGLMLNNIKFSKLYLGMTILNVTIIVCVVCYRIDFAARLGVYTVAISKIFERPLLGYGVEGIKIIPEWMQWDRNAVGFNYAHNEVLQLLLDGGMILFLAYLFLIVKVLNNAEKKINRKDKYLFSVILMAFSIISISESITDYNYFWTFIFIMLYSKCLFGHSLKELK